MINEDLKSIHKTLINSSFNFNSVKMFQKGSRERSPRGNLESRIAEMRENFQLDSPINLGNEGSNTRDTLFQGFQALNKKNSSKKLLNNRPPLTDRSTKSSQIDRFSIISKSKNQENQDFRKIQIPKKLTSCFLKSPDKLGQLSTSRLYDNDERKSFLAKVRKNFREELNSIGKKTEGNMRLSNYSRASSSINLTRQSRHVIQSDSSSKNFNRIPKSPKREDEISVLEIGNMRKSGGTGNLENICSMLRRSSRSNSKRKKASSSSRLSQYSKNEDSTIQEKKSL